MSPQLIDCETKALQLPPAERAVLAEHLIRSLDQLEDAQNERLWIVEAERRYLEYKRGTISARPSEDVLHDARAALK